MRAQSGLSLLMFAAACAGSNDPTPTIVLPPIGIQGGKVPVDGSGHAPTIFAGGGGGFTFIGPTAPGNATYTAAPVTDPMNGPPPSPGGGSMSVTINGTLYSSSALQSMALTFSDPNGNAYVALDGFTLYDNGGVQYADEVVVIVKQSDFAVGATVALDGVDRVALFANGQADSQEPTLVGAAVTGTVTFTVGSLTTGGTITGSVAGDFGQIDWTGGGGGGGGGAIVAGNYNLALQGPSQVFCQGSLAGHEADFAGITAASLNLGGGAVAVAVPDTTSITLDGPTIASDFGTTPIALDSSADAPPGTYVMFTTETGAGPDATSYLGRYLIFDGSSATPTLVNGGAGAGYGATDGSTCTVAFGATLTP